MAQIELISFIPEIATYQIWHPGNFLVNEDEDGIVTITSPETDSNLTLSSYTVNGDVSKEVLLDFFADTTENYTAISEMKTVVTDVRIWIEREFYQGNIFWIWWALSHSNRIIIASINSESELSEADRYLYTFMIDKMEIYPDED
jgi:hypothetical protein